MNAGLHGYLSRGHDGRYVFSRQVPVVAVPFGSSIPQLYPVHGDPFFTGLDKTMCAEAIHAAGVELKPLQTRRCAIQFTALDDGPAELD